MPNPKKEPYTFDPERFADAVVELRKHEIAFKESTKYTQKSLFHLNEANKWRKTVDTWLIFRNQKPTKE